MTDSPPPEPGSPQKSTLGFDEFIGIFVAFTVIGTILFFAIAKNRENFKLTNLSSPFPSSSAQLTPTPTPQAKTNAASVPQVPKIAATPSPKVMAPVPSPTSVAPVIPAVIPSPTQTPTTAATRKPANPGLKAGIAANLIKSGKPIKFVDVPQNFWARPYIDALAARGIFAGIPGGYFRPDQPVSRAELAAVVKQAFDKSPVQSGQKFKDVPSNYWASSAIDEAYKEGFVARYPQNFFKPRQRITRAQALVALVNGLGIDTKSNQAQTLSVYKDAEQIPTYATDKIAAATQAGLVFNYPDPKLLRPTQSITRAELAALIYQALAKEGKVEKTDSPYVVKP